MHKPCVLAKRFSRKLSLILLKEHMRSKYLLQRRQRLGIQVVISLRPSRPLIVCYFRPILLCLLWYLKTSGSQILRCVGLHILARTPKSEPMAYPGNCFQNPGLHMAPNVLYVFVTGLGTRCSLSLVTSSRLGGSWFMKLRFELKGETFIDLS